MKLKLKETLADIFAYLLQVERKKLLWSSAGDSMGASTISINLTDYDAVEVHFYVWSGDKRHSVITRCDVGKNAVAVGLASANTAGGNNSMASYIDPTNRAFMARTTGVTFAIGKEANFISGNVGFSDASHVLTPYRIYGIKMGGYCVTQLFQGLQRFSHRSCLGVM
ncbi:MAG: hypothetical protein IKE74_03285 [Mogibacterium sp.]|nr:hypothetical protein [Mogibacterium sp.]